MPAYHIAQLNLAKAKYSLDDPRMAGFVKQLAAVNSEGENSSGFVWILKDETGTAVNFNLFDDPSLLVNLTVWQDIESMKQFVYNGLHLKVFKNRKAWFEPMEREHLVLWWIPPDHVPSLKEARLKMEKLWTEGPSLAAFNFKKLFKSNY
ncbi:MAG: DUF3291 domain-containing protein [Cyclobacteriaceae bacterium]